MNQSEVSAVLVGCIVNDERTMREMESLNSNNLHGGGGGGALKQGQASPVKAVTLLCNTLGSINN